jgi:NADH:ubiquinone oxidoreductase subunit K
MNLQNYLVLAAGMLSVGVYGLLTRKDAVGLLLSLELMANSANVVMVAFSWARHATFGQVFALFGMALTVVEVGAGLALLLLLYRIRRDVSVDAVSELKQ